MLLLGAIVAVVVVGVGAFASKKPVTAAEALPNAPGNLGPISTTGHEGTAPAQEGKKLPPKPIETSNGTLKDISTGLGVAGVLIGTAKGLLGAAGVGTGTAVATTATGTGTATAATTGGVTLSVVASYAVAVVIVVAAVVVGIFQLVSDLDRLRHGPAGYVAELVKLAHETAAGFEVKLKKSKADGGWGMSDAKARALARLIAWDVTIGYNRAAWAYLKFGEGRESVLGVGVSVLGITPEFRHEQFYVARGMGLPDEVGFMYEPAGPVPPKPPNWPAGKRWPSLPPLLEGMTWNATPEWFVFQGLNTTRAQCLADAGPEYTDELRQMADFIGRAMRCSYSLHNKLGPSGQGAAVLDTAGTVLFYVNCGMIGGLATPAHPGGHPHDVGLIAFDSRNGSPCVHDAQLNLGWFFNESISDVPVRPYR